jgi:hypothetical protein
MVGGSTPSVYALAVARGTVYVGGSFTEIGGEVRKGMGAVSATTGALTSWNPRASGAVNALAVGLRVVFAGGSFTSLGAVDRTRLASIDLATGRVTAWNPRADGRVGGAVGGGAGPCTPADLSTRSRGNLGNGGRRGRGDRRGHAMGRRWDPHLRPGDDGVDPLGPRPLAGGDAERDLRGRAIRPRRRHPPIQLRRVGSRHRRVPAAGRSGGWRRVGDGEERGQALRRRILLLRRGPAANPRGGDRRGDRNADLLESPAGRPRHLHHGGGRPSLSRWSLRRGRRRVPQPRRRCRRGDRGGDRLES